MSRSTQADSKAKVTNKAVDTGDTDAELQIGGDVRLEKAPSPDLEVQRAGEEAAAVLAKDAEQGMTAGQTFAEGVVGALEALLLCVTAPEFTQRQVGEQRARALIKDLKGAAPKAGLTEIEVPYQLQELVINPSPLQSRINREEGHTPAASAETARNQAIAEARTAAIAATKRLAEVERPVTREATGR